MSGDLPKMQYKVGFEGTKGSYSEDALMKLFETQPAFKNTLGNMVGIDSFESVCNKVHNKELDLGILPIESSIAGTFYGVIDHIKKSLLSIVGEFEHVEVQCIVGFPGSTMETIQEIASHPLVFDQCRDFLSSTKGKYRLVQTLDTANSCADIQKSGSKTIAAIASARAASIYGLVVLKKIEQSAVTRYVLVSHTAVTPERHQNPRTMLELHLKNQVGSLMKAISAFGMRDINIIKIESRPSSQMIKLQKAWDYVVVIRINSIWMLIVVWLTKGLLKLNLISKSLER